MLALTLDLGAGRLPWAMASPALLWSSPAENVPAGHVSQLYDIGKETGIGTFGVVFKGLEKEYNFLA